MVYTHTLNAAGAASAVRATDGLVSTRPLFSSTPRCRVCAGRSVSQRPGTGCLRVDCPPTRPPRDPSGLPSTCEDPETLPPDLPTTHMTPEVNNQWLR
jgi:hypothetical protein